MQSPSRGFSIASGGVISLAIKSIKFNLLSSDLQMFSEFDVRTDTGKEFHSGIVRGKKEYL